MAWWVCLMNGRKSSDLLSTRNCRLQIMHHKSSMFLIMLRKETWLMELTIFERNARPIINGYSSSVRTHGRIMWKAVSLWEKEGTVKCTSSCFLLIRYRARRLATMEDVAIKVASMHSMNQICVELIMQYTIPHTNIVPISDCYSWDNNLYIVMEYMDRGSLADVVGPTIHWSESSIAYVCKCVLQAMAIIHSTHHIHRDIKSDNILVNSKGEVKLSDFGFATVVTSMNAERTSKVGTPFWMAPELIQGEGYTNKVDVWSLGITALEMADGEPPHFHDPPLKAMRMIHSGPSPTLRQPRNWTASFVDFLSKALDVDSEKRATAESLLSHPFLQFACSSTEFAHQMEQLTEMKKPK